MRASWRSLRAGRRGESVRSAAAGWPRMAASYRVLLVPMRGCRSDVRPAPTRRPYLRLPFVLGLTGASTSARASVASAAACSIASRLPSPSRSAAGGMEDSIALCTQ